MSDNPFRALPSVTAVRNEPAVAAFHGRLSPDDITTAVRAELDAARAMIAAGASKAMTADAIAVRVAARLELDSLPKLRPVINATGIVLHTNLGRAPLAEVAARAAYEAGRGYLNLELDLATGDRSHRQAVVRVDLCRLTGAEAATVVNNCAAATVVVLRAVAAGREVVVSRGQLIEIGGSFRIPDIMAASGATLREVGTTNITRAGDYERAVGPQTAALMRVHTSNYRVRGFTHGVGLDELVALGKKHGVPVIDDAGSGAAVDLTPLGFEGEPVVSAGVAAGADVVLFSGDKLLGGPQAGVIAGRADIIKRIEADPLFRAFRVDKLTLAALEATLRLYRDPASVMREVPVLRMLATPLAELRERAERLAERLRSLPGLTAEVVEGVAFVGGGSLPDQAVPTAVVAVSFDGISEGELAARLRAGTPAIVGRVSGGRLLLDLRAVFERQEGELFDAVRRVVSGPPLPALRERGWG